MWRWSEVRGSDNRGRTITPGGAHPAITLSTIAPSTLDSVFRAMSLHKNPLIDAIHRVN